MGGRQREGRKRAPAGRRRTVGVAIALGTLLAAAGTLALLLDGSLLPNSAERGDGKRRRKRGTDAALSPAGTDGTSAVRPALRPAPPLEPAEMRPAGSIRWPAVSRAHRAAFSRGRRLLDEAMDAYRRGRDPGEGDRLLFAALRQLSRAPVRVPELLAYHHRTLVAPLDRGQHEELRRRAAFCLQRFPDDPFALHALMVAQSRLGEHRRAADLARRLLELRPGDIDAQRILAVSSFELGEWSEAVEAAEVLSELLSARLASTAPPGRKPRRKHASGNDVPADLELEAIEAWKLLAEGAFVLGDEERGIRAARAMLDRIGFPDERAWKHPAARVVLGTSIKVLHRFRAYRDLLEVASFMRERAPDAPQLAMAEGVARLELGDPAAAEPLLRKALRDPANAREVRFHLGLAFSKERRDGEAAREFAELLAEDPWFERAYYQLGLSLSRLGRETEAEAFFERSRALATSERAIRRHRELRAVGDEPAAAATRAEGLLERGRFAEAASALQVPGLENDPRNVVDRLRLHLECLNFEGSRRLVRHLGELLGPEHPDVAGHRALLLWMSGRREEAARTLERVAARPKAPAVWRLELARRLLALDRPREVIETLLPHRRDGSDREESFLLGRAYLRAGEPDRALESLRSISRGDTRWERWEADVYIAHALAAAGEDPREALARLDGLPPRRHHTRAARRARLEALRTLVRREGGEAHEERLREAEADWEVVEETAGEIEALEREIAGTPWSRSAPLHLALADALARSGEERLAIRRARVALFADPHSTGALERLADWLDRPGEVFLRLHYLRRLAALQPKDAGVAERIEKLEERWLGGEARTSRR